MSKPKIYIRDRIYVPESSINVVDVTEEYTYRDYDQMICNKCEFRTQRHCSECDSCQLGGYKGSFCLVKPARIKGDHYLGFPFGDQDRIEKRANINFNRFKVIDQTVDIPFDYEIKFTCDLYDYQEEPVEILAEQQLGLLESKPRTGKCVSGDSVVDTSLGQLSMQRMWSIFGDLDDESVITKCLTTQTQSGTESIDLMHRKKAKTLKVGTHIGHLLSGTYEHPVQVVTPELKVEWRRLDELSVGDWIVSKPGFGLMRDPVQLGSIDQSAQGAAKHILQPTVVTEELAYLTGCWIANGSLTQAVSSGNYGTIGFSSNNKKVQDKYLSYMNAVFELQSEFKHKRTCESVSHHSSELVRFLKHNGLSFADSRHKTIPDYILCSGSDMHVAFLEGYVSCDSTYNDSGVYLCTASGVLYKQLKTMLQSIGIMPVCSIKSKCATNGHRIYRDYGTLSIKCNYFDLFESMIRLDKDRTASRRTKSRKLFLDSDVVPYLTAHVNELPKRTLDGLYYGRKPSKNPAGHMARSTLFRIERAFLPEHMLRYAEFADGVFFQQVVSIQEGPTDWVYDLTVAGSHSFIANGFVVHNTVMSIAASIRAGYKTIIMADQKDFLDGFYETLEEHTNLLELEEIHGKKLFGFPEKMSDYEDFQFILITYQSLIQDTKACRDRLKALNDNFGALVIDEVHRANATCFASVIGSVWMTMRVALTATVKRKDGRQFLVRNLIGPVVAKTDAEALRPTIVAHRTPKNVTTRSAFKGQAGFTKMCQFLARHKQRQETILEWVKKDLAKGRNIVIPVYFKDNIASLVREINAMAGEEICAAFVGGAKSKKLRKDIVNRARTGEIRVVVGVRKLLQLGINVPKWDTIYYVMPMNNAPNWEQESCRICTPMPNKPTPLIRMFLDEHVPQALGCFRSTYKQGVTLGYATSKKTARKLERWLGVVQQREQMKDVPDFFAPNFDTTKKKKQEAIGRSL